MMLVQLVKKDFLIARKYLLLTFLIPLAVPAMLLLRAPEMMGFIAFMMTVIFTEVIGYQYIAMAELKYPKAASLLCAAPYPRSSLVTAKYLFILLIVVLCHIVYSILAVLVPQVEPLSILATMAVYLIVSILYGIYMPVQYAFGFEKTKAVFLVLIVGMTWILPVLIKLGIHVDLGWFFRLPIMARYAIPLIAFFAILLVSIKLSIYIFSKKEL